MRFSVTLRDALYTRLVQEQRRVDRSFSWLVSEALDGYLPVGAESPPVVDTQVARQEDSPAVPGPASGRGADGPPAEKKKKPEVVTTSLGGPQDLPDSQLAKMLEPPLGEEERQRALGELLKDPRIQVGSREFKGPDPKPAGKKR